MQKGKATASPPAMILQNRAPQQNARDPPPSQQRSDDDNPGQVQQMPPGQMHQNLVMQQMHGPPPGQPRLPNKQPFYPNQRSIRIPRHQPPNNQPMYCSPPEGPPMAVQMIDPPGTTQFMPPGQYPPFITQPMLLPVPGPVALTNEETDKTEEVVTVESQSVFDTPPLQAMTRMPQYQTQTFEPRARERKIIQIKDPNSNKDMTQEILNRQCSGRLTGSTGGTSNKSTSHISGQSSSSSIPPLTSQQQAEANVRAQFAAQVAALLSKSEDKPKKPEVIIQKAPVNNKTVVDTVQLKETTATQKNEVVKETRTNPTAGIDTHLAEKPVEKPLETQPKEVIVKTQPKEAVQGSKLSEGVSGDISLGPKSLVSSVDVTTSAKEIIPNVRVEIFTAYEVRKKEARQISVAAAGEVKPERKQKSEETAKEPVSDVMPVTETKILNGPVALTNEETDKTEEVVTVESQPVVDPPPVQAMTGMPQYQTQTFEPRARERKIIQIKDPNSNKDMTQEILNRQRSGRLTGSTGGTSNKSTSHISGQSSSSSIPPLTLQQQAEANVRAQFAAQVAALLGKSEDKPKKPEVIIQKAPVNNKAVVDTVQLKETTVTQKNEVVKETRTNPATGIDTHLAERPVEKPLETQPKEVLGSKLSEGVSGDISLGPKSLVGSVDATTSAKDIIPNVRVEILTADEVRKKEAQQISFAPASEIKPERKQKLEETAKELVSDVMLVTETKILDGPVALITIEETDKTEEVVTFESQPVVDTPPVQAMTGMPQYQTQTFEPRARERKIIQIKDPNSNKDMTQEILNRQCSGRLTGSNGGTPNNIIPDISGQSSSSSIPPLTLQLQAEANVRVQFAAQVAATLGKSEDKPKKPEVIIQKAPVNNEAVVFTVQLKETTVTQKNEVVKETKTNPVTGIDTQLLPEANVRAQFAAQAAAKGETERELTEVHCDESKISQKHLEELRIGEYISLSGLKTQLMEMKKQLRIKDEQLRVTKEQLRKSEDQLRVKDEQQQTMRAEKEKQEKENAKLQDQLSRKLEDFSELEKEHRDSLQDQVDLENKLEEANKKIIRYESQLMTRDWIISRDEIEIMFDNCLGCGGYGTVYRGRYRGFVVAVKTLKAFSLNSGGRDLFEREMDIASRCRHPCLLQFIGATQEENPLFVTELMELSLRKLINQRRLAQEEIAQEEIVVISLDVAHALNYLHNRKPSPIVHRDVSSANVLLWKQNNQWRGKLGDYGTVKFLQDIMTISPGAMIYSAPEAGSPHNQTVKIDVYSFGVLLCEMFTGKLPVFEERKKHVALVPNGPSREFRDLVLRCTEEDPKERPSMEKVIKKLEKV